MDCLDRPQRLMLMTRPDVVCALKLGTRKATMIRNSLVILILFLPMTTRADVSPASPRFRQIVADYWNDLLKRHPIEATMYVGDHRFDDRVNDVSLDAYHAWLKSLRATLNALKSLDANALPKGEQTDREVLVLMIQDRLDLERFGDHFNPLVQIVRTPTDVHSDDLHLVFSQLGEFQPASTVGDVENFVRRLNGFPKLAEGLINVLKVGMAEKRVVPKVVATRVLAQLRDLAKPNAEQSPLWDYVERLPEDWSQAEKTEASARIRKAIETSVVPAYAKLAEFVEKTYLPVCRETIGLCDTPDGTEHYALLVRHYTTTNLTPEQIHQSGLDEVKKIREAMEAIRKKVGFEGDLKAFFRHLRTDPKFQMKDEASIVEGHRAIIKGIEAKLPELFGRLPVTPVEVRPFDPVRAKSAPGGEYLPVPSDGSRPGIFFVNTSDPKTRPSYTLQPLAYHETIPGHHLQGSIALETPGRPLFRRYFYLPAYDEGWALYSEALPAEVGLYTDPYAEFGRLNYDAFRSVRLVVDTGIHSKGWTRDQAIAYFEANTSDPRNMIENEVDRYIAWPGQALAYKVGQLTIRSLRSKEEGQRGKAFDVKAFHDRLLGSGSLPLKILERVMQSR